ncbi:MAG: hypothetical protein IJQ85_07965 [Selenomonadaceae bacterium]|nr:hypothetical protein [Selenomonadaceae bacterium]
MQWLNEVVIHNVKPTSIETYFSNFKNHIISHLGEMKVQDLTPAILDEWLRKLLQKVLAQKIYLKNIRSERRIISHFS